MIHRLHKKLARPRPWQHLRPAELPAVRRDITTADGQVLALRHVQSVGDQRRRPVILMHGLGANHAGWHYPERSLASYLAARGHDVWMPELRGHGDSHRERYDWRIDDYLHHDIPAIVGSVLQETGADDVTWVGHSMGGVLLYCYGVLHPNAPIARAVTIGSALDYRVGATGFRQLLALKPILDRLVAVPFGTLTHLLAPTMGGRFKAIEGFNVWPSNIEPEVTRQMHANFFDSIPVSLLASLATTFDGEGLRLEDGFPFAPYASRIDFPIRLLAGSRDEQVSVDAITHTAELIGPNAEVRVHGVEAGDRDEYGHFDLILGRRAASEVWPELAAFLEGDDG